MRQLQPHKISNPDDRFERISRLMNNMSTSFEEFQKWNIKVAGNFIRATG